MIIARLCYQILFLCVLLVVGMPALMSSLSYDVTGELRREAIKTPESILGSRPNASPNIKVFIQY